MDNLNKHQIILLALLVAFVSSIATGITVVSLMDQAPEPVTQTINRVVEKTIETIVPQIDTSPKEKTTVVVKEEDLTISAIDKNSKSLIRIYTILADGSEYFISDGLIVSDSGFIIADKLALVQSSVYGSYKASLYDGTKIGLEHVANDDVLGLTLLKAKLDTGQNVKFNQIVWADSDNVKLGQSIISLALDLKKIVNIGNVVSLDTKDSKNTSITANSEITNSVPGSIIFNLNGEVVGFHTGTEKQLFLASNVVKTAVNTLLPK